MENNLLQQKLNSTLTQLESIDNSVRKSTKFLVGDFFDVLTERLKDVAISQKVAIISSENTFIKISQRIKDALSKNDITALDYLFSGTEKISLESLSKLFCLPDDIRAIIVTDSFLVGVAGFYATIKNIPLYIISCGLDVGESLESAFLLKDDREYKVFEVTCKKIFIIDSELTSILNINLSTAFDYVASNIVSLIDEKINFFFTDEKPVVTLYNKKNKAVINSFSVLKYPQEKRYEFLVENCAICGLVNGIYGKKLLEINSLETIKLLLNKDSFGNNSVLLFFAVKIMKLYAILCKKEVKDLFLIEDYNSVTENFAKALDIKEEIVVDDLLEKRKKIDESKKSLTDFIDKFSNEILPLSIVIDSAKNIHFALNGEDLSKLIKTENVKKVISISGAYGKKITGLSLFLLSGLNNLI